MKCQSHEKVIDCKNYLKTCLFSYKSNSFNCINFAFDDNSQKLFHYFSDIDMKYEKFQLVMTNMMKDQ